MQGAYEPGPLVWGASGSKVTMRGFPGGAVVESPPGDARGRGFVPRSGKILHAAERLGP